VSIIQEKKNGTATTTRRRSRKLEGNDETIVRDKSKVPNHPVYFLHYDCLHFGIPFHLKVMTVSPAFDSNIMHQS
jgi:hypothetical protein